VAGESGAGDFEGAIHSVNEEPQFLAYEVAIRVEFLELGGGGARAVLAMFFQVNDFANEPGEDVEEAGVFERVFGEFLLEGLGGEVAKELEILAGDDLEGGLGEGGGVIGSDHIEGGLAVGLE
jgi:hypothetical protein